MALAFDGNAGAHALQLGHMQAVGVDALGEDGNPLSPSAQLGL